MSDKHRGGPAPIPPGNRPHVGPQSADPGKSATEEVENTGVGFQEQDPQRRLGGYGGAGEHPRQQPGGLNDGDVHSR
jgi:hypothetical protein